jgi:hypothetical protein
VNRPEMEPLGVSERPEMSAAIILYAALRSLDVLKAKNEYIKELADNLRLLLADWNTHNDWSMADVATGFEFLECQKKGMAINSELKRKADLWDTYHVSFSNLPFMERDLIEDFRAAPPKAKKLILQVTRALASWHQMGEPLPKRQKEDL